MHTNKKNYQRPVMAVLVSSESISRLQNQVPDTRIRLLVKANQKVGNVLYFFSLRDVMLKKNRIVGYYWHNRKKRWLHQEFPLPDILYVRCRIDKKYNHTFPELRSKITKNNGGLITHKRFNKWRLYQIMSKDPAMNSYLPATRTVKGPEDINKMLQEYNVVYLKSHVGKKGENVLQAEVLPGGSYRYSYYRHGKLTVRSAQSFKGLLNVINQFFQDREFLIQQGIQLLNFKNKLIDMRAELQHNGNGSLEIAGISVRYGRPGSPITTHGDAVRFDDFFINKMGYSKKQLKVFRDVIQKFLFGVYEYIENNYSSYAEMGIDFAVDADKKIWFIEANSQSTRVSLNRAYGKAVQYRYYKNILEYAKYLSGRPKPGEN